MLGDRIHHANDVRTPDVPAASTGPHWRRQCGGSACDQCTRAVRPRRTMNPWSTESGDWGRDPLWGVAGSWTYGILVASNNGGAAAIGAAWRMLDHTEDDSNTKFADLLKASEAFDKDVGKL